MPFFLNIFENACFYWLGESFYIFSQIFWMHSREILLTAGGKLPPEISSIMRHYIWLFPRAHNLYLLIIGNWAGYQDQMISRRYTREERKQISTLGLLLERKQRIKFPILILTLKMLKTTTIFLSPFTKFYFGSKCIIHISSIHLLISSLLVLGIIEQGIFEISFYKGVGTPGCSCWGVGKDGIHV